MKKLFALLVILFLMYSFASADEKILEIKKEYNIAFIIDGPFYFHKEVIKQIENELEKLVTGKFTIRYPVVADGEFDRDKIQNEAYKLLRDNNIDIIVSFGLIGTIIFSEIKDLEKPVLCMTEIDTGLFDLPTDEQGFSTKENFTFLSSPGIVKRDILLFKRLVNFKKLYILIDESVLPIVQTIAATPEEYLGIPLECEYIEVGDSIDNVLEKIPSSAEAVYITPLSHLSDTDYARLITALDERKIPTFTAMRRGIKNGALATADATSYEQFFRRVALNLYRIMLGEGTRKLNVVFDRPGVFTINMKTARKIGLSPKPELFLDATILYSEDEDKETLTLMDAVNEALNNNYLFFIKDKEIEASRQDYGISWSNYLPQVELDLTYYRIDKKRAEASFGLLPRKSESVGANLNQLIFSDPIIASIRISKRQLGIEKLERVSYELDIAELAIKSYLNLLIRKKLLAVELKNLERIKDYLQKAKTREKIGVSGPEEVYRWEAELASRKSSYLESEAKMNEARISLNQVMNRPLESDYFVEELDENVGFGMHSKRISKYADNLKNRKIMSDYLVDVAFRFSPELETVRVAIESKNIEKNMLLRKFFLPSVIFQGEAKHYFDRDYMPFDPEDDLENEWSIGVSAQYPLFEGTKKFREFKKAKAELGSLNYTMALSEQEVELGVRNAIYQLFYSEPNIHLSRVAAVNARKNLDLVSVKYEKGLVAITDLLDAQNENFSEESQASIAVYSYLIDLTTLFRKISSFDLVLHDENIEEIMDQFELYMDGHGADMEEERWRELVD